MYDPAVIAEKEAYILGSMRSLFPSGFPEYALADRRALTAQIAQAYDPEAKALTRTLSAEEQAFIVMAQVRILQNVPFFLETFCYIDEEGHGIRPLYPLWGSQQFALKKIGQIEAEHARSRSLDGILVNFLKVRQVGISTFGAALVAHRILTQPNIRAIVGSDTEEQAKYLFRMIERIHANLPYFLQPTILSHLSGREMVLSNGSSIKTAWGKTTRGALQEVGGKKGNIERGRTNSVVLISELATWDNPEQLDSSLLPGIPINEKTLVLFESTAELAGDWWHQHYLAAEEGAGRFQNAFISWPIKYSMPAPADWRPCEETLAVAASIERDSPRWGYPLTLTRDHLYWYETTRAYYVSKNQLHTFLKEYPSNPEECFQYAGQSVFSLDELAQIDQQAKKLLDVWAVEPSREIAELRQLAESTGDLKEDVKALGLREDLRKAAPVVTRISERELEKYPVPPGYGFRRLAQRELDALPSLRHSVMAIFEYPRSRGQRRYVLGVDVGDGLGLDYSVISVIRLPTIEESAEEVAQYVSNTVRPSHLAFICDAIGRFYSDEEGLEALAAVELNNHGAAVQDLLQLHLGYSNFYVWEVVDAADPSARYTKRIGWSTTSRTRPILLEKFHDAVTTLDPISGFADFRLHSPTTRAELRHFVTEGLLGEAEHAKGQHDDAIFASAIGYFVAWRQAGGESEPIAERRRRRQELRMVAAQTGRKRDYRNSAITAEEVDDGRDPDEAEFDELWDDRSHA
jgi:hypothetical protein